MKMMTILIYIFVIILLSSFAYAVTDGVLLMTATDDSNASLAVNDWGTNGTLQAGTNYTTDYFAIYNISGNSTPNSFSFNGTGNIIVNDVFGIGNTNVSVSLWVNLSSVSLKGAFIHIGVENTNGFSIGVGNGNYDTAGNEVIMLFDLVRWIDINQNIGTGSHHVGFVMDSDGTPIIYLDGVSVGSSSGTNAIAPTTTVLIGGGGGRKFNNGEIDVITIINRSLTATEMKNLYNCNDTEGCGDTTDPTITLNTPTDNFNYTTSTTVEFNCTAYDDVNLTNVTLYHNITGSWVGNITNTSGINNSDYTWSQVFNQGDFNWSCYACDNSSNCAFASANYTFTVDTVNPTVSINKNGTILEFNVNDSVQINWSGSDSHLDSVIFNITYPNGTELYENDTAVRNVNLTHSNFTVVGNYTISLYANDTFAHENTATDWIYIEDTIDPVITAPDNVTLEYLTDALGLDFNHTDHSSIDTWYTNHSSNFTINGSGYIINATALVIGTYWVNVSVNDTSNNTATVVWNVNVSDTTTPVILPPNNLTLEYGSETLLVDFNATELLPDTWYTNHTSNFTINSSGHLYNTTQLEVANYYVNVSLNDTSNNTANYTFNVNVSDTAAPTITAPANATLTNQVEALSVDFNATDFSSLDTWYINFTSNFSIDASGILTNTTNLSLGNYYINVSINDTYNNTQNHTYYVNVTSVITTFNITIDTSNGTTTDLTPPVSFTTIGSASSYDCDLYFDASSVGSNTSVANNTATEITPSSVQIGGNKSIYVNCTVSGVTNQSNTIWLNLNDTVPTVTLNTPADNGSVNSTSVTYNCTNVDTYDLKNVTLYNNATGNWVLNNTNSSGVNNTEYLWTHDFNQSLNNIIWNCYACDDFNCSWGATNYSFDFNYTTGIFNFSVLRYSMEWIVAEW